MLLRCFVNLMQSLREEPTTPGFRQLPYISESTHLYIIAIEKIRRVATHLAPRRKSVTIQSSTRTNRLRMLIKNRTKTCIVRTGKLTSLPNIYTPSLFKEIIKNEMLNIIIGLNRIARKWLVEIYIIQGKGSPRQCSWYRRYWYK